MLPKTKRKFDDEYEDNRSTRTKRLPRITELEIDVDYGMNGTIKWAQTIMAMTAPMSMNSNTSDAVNVGIRVRALNLPYKPKRKFVIGHLINEQFPRPIGDCNFVPLTNQANCQHKSQIETKLARFLTGMNGTVGDDFNRMLDNNMKFGILYRVETSPNFWDVDIPEYIRWRVKLGVYNEDGVEQVGVETDLLARLKAIASRNYKISGIENDNGITAMVQNGRVTVAK